jgi:hypothetical protein
MNLSLLFQQSNTLQSSHLPSDTSILPPPTHFLTPPPSFNFSSTPQDMQIKLTVIIAIFAIAATAAPVPDANALVPRVLPGEVKVATNGTVRPNMAPAIVSPYDPSSGSSYTPPDREMTETAATNTDGNVQSGNIVDPNRTMSHTAVTTNVSNSCNIAFDAAQTTIEASQDVTATLAGLISQNKALSSLLTLYANIFKTLWPGYSTTIKTEFKPFAVTLPTTDAGCRSQIDVCLNSLLSASKLVGSSASGAAAACTVTK